MFDKDCNMYTINDTGKHFSACLKRVTVTVDTNVVLFFR